MLFGAAGSGSLSLSFELSPTPFLVAVLVLFKLGKTDDGFFSFGLDSFWFMLALALLMQLLLPTNLREYFS